MGKRCGVSPKTFLRKVFDGRMKEEPLPLLTLQSDARLPRCSLHFSLWAAGSVCLYGPICINASLAFRFRA